MLPVPGPGFRSWFWASLGKPKTGPRIPVRGPESREHANGSSHALTAPSSVSSHRNLCRPQPCGDSPVFNLKWVTRSRTLENARTLLVSTENLSGLRQPRICASVPPDPAEAACLPCEKKRRRSTSDLPDAAEKQSTNGMFEIVAACATPGLAA